MASLARGRHTVRKFKTAGSTEDVTEIFNESRSLPLRDVLGNGGSPSCCGCPSAYTVVEQANGKEESRMELSFRILGGLTISYDKVVGPSSNPASRMNTFIVSHLDALTGSRVDDSVDELSGFVDRDQNVAEASS